MYPMMTYEYLAGYFDGEGCVGFYAKNQPRRYNPELLTKRRANHRTIQISSTNRPFLEMVQSFTGLGSIYHPNHKGRSRPLYIWTVSKKSEIEQVLTLLLPYLIGKRPEVELALAELRGEIPMEEAAIQIQDLKWQ